MPKRTNLPPNAAVAAQIEGAKLSAPAAERNAEAIRDVLVQHTPAKGEALEIASGTGQHVVSFARAMPGLTWLPSEVDPERIASINAWAAEAQLGNLRPAMHLDATEPGWAVAGQTWDLILCINLLHLVSEKEAQCLVSEAATALRPEGQLVIYGPFLRNGEATSPGDERFHSSLVAQDPAIGYKDVATVKGWMDSAGLTSRDPVEMPANNLCLIAGCPG